MAEVPEDIREHLRVHLTAIAKLFRVPLITIIVRSPDGGNVGGDLHFGNDNPTLALDAFRKLLASEASKVADEPGK